MTHETTQYGMVDVVYVCVVDKFVYNLQKKIQNADTHNTHKMYDKFPFFVQTIVMTAMR